MEVKRYDVVTYPGEGGFMAELPNSGPYILYTDHLSALAEATEKAWREGVHAGIKFLNGLDYLDSRKIFASIAERDAIVSQLKGAPPL